METQSVGRLDWLTKDKWKQVFGFLALNRLQ